MSSRTFASLAALTAGLVGGWVGVGTWVGSERFGADDAWQIASAPEANEVAAGKAAIAKGDLGRPASAAELEAAIRRLVIESDGFAAVRIRRLIENAGGVGAEQLPGLVEKFARNPSVVNALLEAWVDLDPAAALRWVTTNALRRQKWEETMVRGWARNDLDAAWMWVMAQPLRAESWKTRAGLVEAAAEHDPADALGRMREAGWLLTQRNALIRLFRVWGARDPFSAVSAATETVRGLYGESEPRGGDLLGRVLTGLVEGVTLTDLSQVARLAEKLLLAHAGDAAGKLLADWPDVVEQSAERWLSQPGGESLLDGWVKHSGVESVNLLLNLPEGPQKQRLLGSVCALDSMSAEAVVRVRSLVHSVPSGYSDLAGRLAESLASTRPAEAVAVWADLPAEQQSLSQEFFFRFLGKSDSEAASQCLAALDEESQVKVLPRFCEGLAASSPEHAWDVVAMQTESVVRSEAAAMTLAVWASKDEAAAMAQFEAAASTLDLGVFLEALPRTGHVGTPNRAAAYGGNNIIPLRDRAKVLQAQGSPP